MWVDFVQACGPVFIGLSTARDAGIWFFQMNAPYISAYMESFVIKKGWLS